MNEQLSSHETMRNYMRKTAALVGALALGSFILQPVEQTNNVNKAVQVTAIEDLPIKPLQLEEAVDNTVRRNTTRGNASASTVPRKPKPVTTTTVAPAGTAQASMLTEEAKPVVPEIETLDPIFTDPEIQNQATNFIFEGTFESVENKAGMTYLQIKPERTPFLKIWVSSSDEEEDDQVEARETKVTEFAKQLTPGSRVKVRIPISPEDASKNLFKQKAAKRRGRSFDQAEHEFRMLTLDTNRDQLLNYTVDKYFQAVSFENDLEIVE